MHAGRGVESKVEKQKMLKRLAAVSNVGM